MKHPLPFYKQRASDKTCVCRGVAGRTGGLCPGSTTSCHGPPSAPLVCCVCSAASSSATPWAPGVHRAPPAMGLSRQEYWSGLPCPPPGDPPDPGIKPASPMSPALVGGISSTVPPGKPLINCALIWGLEGRRGSALTLWVGKRSISAHRPGPALTRPLGPLCGFQRSHLWSQISGESQFLHWKDRGSYRLCGPLPASHSPVPGESGGR